MIRKILSLELLALSTLICFFFLLKSYGLNPAVSDENIYFYDTWLMSKGLLPYQDFFFAHPPLHLIPGWIVMLIAGDFNLTAMKAIPIIATTVTGITLHKIIVRVVGKRSAALFALSMFLFSHDLLRASSHWTGMNLAMCWMSIGLFLAVRQHPRTCGAALGIGISTGVYIVPGAMVLIIMLYCQQTRQAVSCVLSLFAIWLLINVPFFISGGKEYFYSVFLFHLLKPSQQGISFLTQIDQLLFHNFFILSAPLLLIPVLLFKIVEAVTNNKDKVVWEDFFKIQRRPYIAMGLWCLITWSIYILFLLLLNRVYHYYFLLLFPFSTICVGLFISSLITNLKGFFNSRYSALKAMTLSIIVIAGLLVYPLFEHRLSYYQTAKGKVKKYNFPLSRLPDALQLPVQMIWKSNRTIGKRFTGIQYYLWHESRVFSEAKRIAMVLQTNADKTDMIFGDSTSTPLISLFAKISIWNNFVDTNVMRFKAGFPKADELISQLHDAIGSNNLEWVLINPTKGIGKVEVFNQFFKKNFYSFATFRSQYFGIYILMKRKKIKTKSCQFAKMENIHE